MLAASFTGTLHVGEITVEDLPKDALILKATPEEIQRKVDHDGWSAAWG
ncbi:hypothetical protein GCM10009836_24180 [Pseudonocardia ailaonensis]|uniref:Uncharacterized protein n=1 Tax=Pseudonocardia ailaonensis TaxID=367279 RepID=A0ABN2MYQ5_9PSEU